MTTVTLKGSIDDAISILKKYPELASCIDEAKFRERVAEKYPNGPTVSSGDVTDLYTALIISGNPVVSQQNNNAATPEGALINFNDCVKVLGIDAEDRKKLGVKLVNLKTTSFWDTLSELLFARTMLQSTSGNRIQLEFPLGPASKGVQPKDVDVAIVDASGNAEVLFDVVTPNKTQFPISSASDKIIDWIANKYDSKFSTYCAQHPNAKVVIIVCMLKNEEFYTAFPMKLVFKQITDLSHSAVLKSKSGLFLACACTYRSPNGKDLAVDSLAVFQKT